MSSDTVSTTCSSPGLFDDTPSASQIIVQASTVAPPPALTMAAPAPTPTMTTPAPPTLTPALVTTALTQQLTRTALLAQALTVATPVPMLAKPSPSHHKQAPTIAPMSFESSFLPPPHWGSPSPSLSNLNEPPPSSHLSSLPPSSQTQEDWVLSYEPSESQEPKHHSDLDEPPPSSRLSSPPPSLKTQEDWIPSHELSWSLGPEHHSYVCTVSGPLHPRHYRS